MNSQLTIAGLYDYSDGAVFDELTLPATLDTDVLEQLILRECGSFSLVWPDLDYMTDAIGVWCAERLTSWTRMLNALEASYNPIHNYNRTDSFSDQNYAAGSDTRQVRGFDSGTWADSSKDSSNSNYTLTHSGSVSGNIGVTTTQQMINQELELRRTDIYKYIVTEFKAEFCVLVY